jgi:hypothetical protein
MTLFHGDQNESDVSTPSHAYTCMAEEWCLIDDLCGGTKAMREARETWLPKEEKETEVGYRARLQRSFLFPALSDTIDKLAGKPFSQPVQLEGNEKLPEALQGIKDDVDRAGTSLTLFARELFKAGIQYGLTHVLIDFPNIPNAEKATLAQERELGARPYFTHVKPTNVIGWRTERLPNGKIKLVQVRIYETQTEPDGEWGEVVNEYIRVYGVDMWELWKKGPKQEKFVKVDEGIHTFGEVPLKTYYVNKTGFMTAKPPLWDLAELNLCHWQSSSDQRNILRFARIGILFAKGFSDEDLDKGLYIGPNQLVCSSEPNADLRYVEHSGGAIGAGNDDLTKLESQMEILGLQPMIERSAASTATGKMIDEGRTTTDIKTWIRDLEDILIDCYQTAAKWLGQELEEETLKVNLTDTFDLMMRGDEDMDRLLAMSNANKLSDKTLLMEAKRRGLLQDQLDVEEELAAIEAQGPSLADMTGFAKLGGTPGQPGKTDENPGGTDDKKQMGKDGGKPPFPPKG